MQIKIKVDRLKDKIQNIYDKILQLMELCPHEQVEIKHNSDTGNYDPHEDRHWKEYTCRDCGKYWTEILK
jgi:hypothetical protein